MTLLASEMMLLGVAIVALCRCARAQDVDYAQFVNPFIGSEGGISGYACKSGASTDVL
jgi:hypothetical protein